MGLFGVCIGAIFFPGGETGEYSVSFGMTLLSSVESLHPFHCCNTIFIINFVG